MVQKIGPDNIVLPPTFDVLFHLPESDTLRDQGYVVAHAIQYSICETAETMIEALQKLAREVVARCQLAAERGIKPTAMAPEHFLSAFHLGRPVQETNEMSEVCAGLSQELRSRFKTYGSDDISLNMRMTSICEWQRALGLVRVLEFTQRAA